jgi:hypothetical protein
VRRELEISMQLERQERAGLEPPLTATR